MIVPEGWSLILIPACLGVSAVALGWLIAGWILMSFAALNLIVFRNPPRVFSAPPGYACAPADGIVESVVKPSEDDDCLRVVDDRAGYERWRARTAGKPEPRTPSCRQSAPRAASEGTNRCGRRRGEQGEG